MPTSSQMLAMALDFEANADKRLKSKVRLQSGGVALEFVDTDDDATVAKMRLFERFTIAVPVFWSLPAEGVPTPAYAMQARLKYRMGAQPAFWYELIRADRVYEKAALALIDSVREALAPYPFLMGSPE